ncbi:ATP-binding protein [Ferrimonas balearica]|uniref:ATP-binding protein n=1 Tax=Ferrimonas balearica TaxID=44012 RepID=UPI001C998588|nr:ATP-binding protein [Ferrimonas balearica]MBY5991304.1 ATP-binding protein [Ferrimonas balearica]
MSTLKRIILIATHLPGEVELKLDGHTNICGTNASGKTTLQRLVPVFYGEYPSKVVPATRDSFERWYLPTESSYIIYEYQRPGGALAQAVLCSAGDGKGVQYRFVGKGFDIEDYIKTRTADDKVVCFSGGELRRVFKAQNVPVSNAVGSVKDYRAVIQNDRGLIATAGNASELRRLADEFALCERGTTLRHIEKLVRAVHSKEGKMETIRQMVAAILEEDGVETPQTRLNPQRVEEWIRESALVEHFETIRPQFAKLEQRFSQLEVCELELKALGTGFGNDKIVLEGKLEQWGREKREAELQLSDLQGNYEKDHFEQRQAKSAAETDANSYESRLETIEDEHQRWLDLEIEQIKRDLDALPQWRADLQSLRERAKLLTEKHSDIEATYNERRGQIEISNNAALEALRERQDQARSQHADLKNQQQSEMRELEDGFRNQRSAGEQRHHNELKQLELSQQKLQLQIEAAGFTSEERRALDVLEARIDEAYLQAQQAEQALDQARDAEQAKLKERSELQEQLSGLRRNVAQCQSRFDEVDTLRFPKDHSLLKFLRQEQPDWYQSLGKVIRPELLQRNDLKPSLKGEADAFYGIALELGNVDAPDYAQDEQALEQQAEQARQALEQARSAQSALEEELAAKQSELQGLSEAVIRAQTRYQNARSAHVRLNDEKKQQTGQFRAAVSERKLASQKQLKAVEADLARLQSEFEAFIEQLKEQHTEARMDKEVFWQDRLGTVEESLQKLGQDLAARREQKKAELAECERWYQNELKARGVDDSQIAALKQQISDKDTAIARVDAMRDEVKNYESWFKGPFSIEKPELQAKLAKARQEVLELDQALSAAERQFKTISKELKDARVAADQALTQGNEQFHHLKELLGEINKLKLKGQVQTEHQPSGELDERLRDAREKLKQRDEHRRVIKGQIDNFDSQIGQKAGAELQDTWEQSRQRCLTKDGDGVEQIDHIMMMVELRHLMNHLVPQRMEVLRGMGQTFGKDMSSYYEILADIDKRIGTQSKRITREVGEELFLDGVSGSAVQIKSRISDLDFWDELSAFITVYQQWQERNFEGLPGEEYAALLRRALEVIGRTALSGSVAKLLEIELRLREGNSDLVIRTDRQLNESSSHGMAYLILCKFLLAFTRLLRGNSEATIHWPIDELGTLHHVNVKKVFDACEKNRISVLGAFPNPESEVLSLFANRYIINKQTRQLQVVQPKVNLIAERLKAKQQQEEVPA